MSEEIQIILDGLVVSRVDAPEPPRLPPYILREQMTGISLSEHLGVTPYGMSMFVAIQAAAYEHQLIRLIALVKACSGVEVSQDQMEHALAQCVLDAYTAYKELCAGNATALLQVLGSWPCVTTMPGAVRKLARRDRARKRRKVRAAARRRRQGST